MITSPNNTQLKTIRRLHDKRHRERDGLCVVEGEDLVAAARAAGVEPELLLVAGEDVEPRLLDAVSTLGSGARVIGVFPQVWGEPGGEVSVYLHGVADPGNVGTVIRSAHALADGPAVLGPECADPWSPKALRASMGSAFARPPARASFDELTGTTVALVPRDAPPLWELDAERPVVLCLGAERRGLPDTVLERCSHRASVPLRAGGPDSLNVAMAATVALYELNRMAGHA
ncbi:MAG: methyltransferase, TrmH family [Thermoleophilaceae bacterium]|jgi:TrmH family RNA methyltransferase|nr:methyltransferase, TrmH family [Thermoleophilaceae bacterium]MEA2352382.1 methyltransferase, TrmH family [Thermoleophilaceae bacterium]